MNEYRQLVIVAGTGRNSGKTTLVCNILEKFSHLKPLAVKISPHLHKASQDILLVKSQEGFLIYRETSLEGIKDTSRMLVSGASESYYIHAYDHYIGEAFNWFVENIAAERAIVCESPSLRKYINPGVFIIADSDRITEKRDFGELASLADLTHRFNHTKTLPGCLHYSDGGWTCI